MTESCSVFGDRKEAEGGITKEQKKTFRGDGYVHDLDCGDSFVGIFAMS